jgi:hypothetical protein
MDGWMDGRERLDCTFVWLIDEWMDVDGTFVCDCESFYVRGGRETAN